MTALIQRVRWAEALVAGEIIARIDRGLLVYVGVSSTDVTAEAQRLAEKVAALRIFEDEAGKMNRSVQDVGGGVLAISNFTLLADASKGRRPAFAAAAGAERAEPLYESFLAKLQAVGCRVAKGRFGADMIIHSAADGPVNILLDWPPVPPVQKQPKN